MPVYLQTTIVLPEAAGAVLPVCASAAGAAAIAADVTAADSMNLRRENFIDHSTIKFASMVTKRKGAFPRPFILCLNNTSSRPFFRPYSGRSGSATAHPHFRRGRIQDHR